MSGNNYYHKYVWNHNDNPEKIWEVACIIMHNSIEFINLDNLVRHKFR